ncbi:MAG: hypothetical protein JWQ38_3630, partial [Flavipsychrobacter sp.]|nr:hypothetical protein [Flavipsychrobacter sp.]
PSRNIGYASVQHESSYYIPFNTWFLKTTDGGKTWIENHFFANYNEEGIGFINDNVGWIGGDERIGTFKTTDGGDTWYNDESFGVPTPPYTSGTSGFSMNRFRSFGDTVMYASGNTIYKLKRDATGVRELSIGNESIGNYPNPFKEQTTITYYLPEAADNLILRVINMLGQQVYTKALGSCLKGNNQFLFNEGFPGGVYYYTISNDKFRVTRKMMVIK